MHVQMIEGEEGGGGFNLPAYSTTVVLVIFATGALKAESG